MQREEKCEYEEEMRREGKRWWTGEKKRGQRLWTAEDQRGGGGRERQAEEVM